MDNYSLSDLRAATENDGWGGGGGGWIMIILFALIFGWGGAGFGGNRGGSPVTEADLCSANSFSELKGSVGRLSDQIGAMYTGLQNGLSNFGYETLRNFNETQSQLAACCCETNRNIDAVRYDAAQNTQKILDAISGNRMADMQNQINQLQLREALCGVVRYPNSFAYNAGSNPFCGGCGCGLANI